MAQYELNIRDYLRIIRKRKVIILLTFIIVTAASIFFTPDKPIVYKATTTVKIEEQKTVAGLLTEWIIYTPGDIMQSQAAIIKGFNVIEKAALRLGMIDSDTPTEKVNRIVTALQKRIDTKIISQTNIIEITATAGEPRQAMDLANMVAQVYIEENLLERNKQARTVRQFIQDQLSSVEQRLMETEQQLRTFRGVVKDILLSSPIQKKLTSLEFEIFSLKQKYTDKHPQILQIKDQIKDLENQFKGFSEKELEYARLSREVEVNRRLYATLTEKLEEARITEAHKIGNVSVINPAVMPPASVPAQKGLTILAGALMGILLGIILAFVSESLDTSLGTIEDVETLTKLPVLGVAPPVRDTSEKIKNFFKRWIGNFFHHRKTRAEEFYVRMIVHNDPKSTVAEAYRAIRANLRLTPLLKTILITSTGPREGKTTVLVNLGLAIAQSGVKTLLISSDLRRPTVAKNFGVRQLPGLSEVLTKSVTLDEALRNIADIILGKMKLDKIIETPGMEYLSILPSGHIPHNPAELLESKRIKDLIDELEKRFDIILFDSPPVLPLADAILLAPHVNGVVLVYEAGRTAKSALLRAKLQLESTGAKILGIVLNHTRPETESAAGYPYYYYRYKYYGEKPDKKHKKTLKEKNPAQTTA